MFFDVNCTIGTWPFRPSPLADPSALAAHLESEHVDGALVSNIESLFVLDVADSNQALYEACSRYSGFFPAPILNPRMRNWRGLTEDYLRRSETKAIRIHPNYHFYDLSHPSVGELCSLLGASGTPLIIAPRVFDERLHNPRMAVAGASVEAVADLATRHPDLPVICVNAYLKEARDLALPANLFFDIAFMEYFKTLDTILKVIPEGQLLFGSNTPIHATRAASMKVAWAQAGEPTRRLVARDNAGSLFGIE